jgi:2-oxoisovalerate dehydrogenase E1 component
MPSNPADAKGMMKTALRGYDPVLIMEPKTLFATKGEVPGGEHLVPFGVAKVIKEGRNLTLVTCGTMVPISLSAAEVLEQDGVSCEVIDLRTLVPLDVATIAASLAKTGHMLIVDEGYSMCGMGAEIAQSMMELAFDDLDAPIGRIHTDPAAHPFAFSMLEAIMPTVDKVVAGAREVMAGRAPQVRRAQGPGASAAAAAISTSAPAPAGKAAPSALAKAAATKNGATVKGEPVNMPHGDLTVTEATVVKWYKKVGDAVAKGEAVVDVETDKAVSAVESPIDGTLAQVVEAEGNVVKMGQLLAVVSPR